MYVSWETCRGKKESSLYDYCSELTHKGATRAFADLIDVLVEKKVLDEDNLQSIFGDHSLTIKSECNEP